ncbi:DUF805 domain-containing protein [Pseudomonas protegens]|uniref:DUF805 domain-containing protein n=1 Tax=Pseudomonas protegens TaxID=380021 RepID=UPI0004423FBA|nr:DUF805 domain-containing protein [Pseudomonas protegens]MBP5107384.1 DUF805 domain-containing protein [Pseudomonas protegens]MBP5133208.1 DUF805 domain-containing protein [Pseudomonas protegens]MBP5150291.1 DUF805 domain-containing protein [Pseudomonas protegens]MCD9571437.1 DUF805 domain-containing protein [Pseudomonas protegens]MCU1768312.1 DUF805 domain-containing protein [Pseudomonas protegens]
MSETRYKIVFDGTLLPGVEKATAQLNLAELFKSDAAAVERLFSGQQVELKRDLTQADAQRYLEALKNAGIDARIESEQALKLDLDAVTPTPRASSLSESPYAPPQAAVGDAIPQYAALNVFSFEGRIGRLRYLAWTLVLTVAMLAVVGVGAFFGILSAAVFNSTLLTGLGIVGGIVVFIGFLVVSIQISVQRLHDLGWSGWLWLLNFVPIVGSIFPLVLMVSPGSNVANRYGAPPPPNTTAVKVLSWMWVVLIVALIVGMVAGGLSSLEDRYSETSYSESIDSSSADEDAEPADIAAPVESESEQE